MKTTTTIQATYARPDQTCRKTITLNGGPFKDYTIGLHEIGSLAGLLFRVEKECRHLSSPAAGNPHRLTYEIDTWQPDTPVQQENSFTLPSFEEMSAFMDAEMVRIGMVQTQPMRAAA
ncbi:hypothetical protein [Hydrogenophaga taeniospiralis]|uniref:hypothetical protein n=1 Tax=Hydrogenophaga taeniospiralis TaxID=65656 RepID=UPI001CFC3C14|nr:hypothetical protein [Hydrogenophaga taeniospiralis]UCU93993.1 hypothetical protein KI616_25200 [Hydrogenophaga taeniospiralis]